ncbi:MAG: hypothetical protein FWG70_10500 [Oscillospiraceae bacterium]|nr:hypothetical protein [Oscillospiraceae bacterium]
MHPIIITTLGEFSISYGNKVITEKERRSKNMWVLLKYLTTFADRAVPQEELIELLWSNDGLIGPASALKTLLSRIRNSLSVLGFPPNTDLVVSYSGIYTLNKSFEYIIDTVQFEKNAKESMRDDISEKEQIQYAKRALAMYGGDFLKNTAYEKWLIPARVYYHSIFVRVIHRLSDTLFEHKQYTDIINVCRKALLIESSDQIIHMNLIKALAALGDRDNAKKHYRYVMDLLYNKIGVNPIPELKNLYRETIETDAEQGESLETIQKKLRETNSETESGAFYCEPEVFKSIYRLKMRDSARSMQRTQICLITVTDPTGGEVEPKQIIDEMKRLHDCVSASLRKSDIFARYSLSQYVLMLSYANYDTSEVVLNRIEKKYKEKTVGFMLDINFKYTMVL